MRLPPYTHYNGIIIILTDCDSDHSFSSNQGLQSVVSIPLEPEVDGLSPTIQTNMANAADTSEAPVLALDNDILDALGISKTKPETFAPKIRDEISERWGRIIVDGLSKESLQKLMESIHIPENFKLLKAPELNTEISTVLSQTSRNRDKRLEKNQNHLGKGIAAITNLMSMLINAEMEKTDIIKKLSEIGQLLLDLHCQNTYSRRKLITFSLDKKFLTMIQGVKRDSFLFGEKLGDKIKANKSAERSGFQIKRSFEPQQSTSSYRPNQQPVHQGNWRGPSKPQSHTQRGRRGGHRFQATAQASRRPPVTTDRYNTPPAKTNNNKPDPKN